MLFLPLPQAELQSNTSPPPFPVPNFPVLIFTACCPRSLPVPWVRWQVTQEVWVGAQRFFSADPCHPPLLCLVWVLLGAAPTLGFRGSPPAACWRVPGGRACSILCIAVVPPIKDPPPFLGPFSGSRSQAANPAVSSAGLSVQRPGASWFQQVLSPGVSKFLTFSYREPGIHLSQARFPKLISVEAWLLR